MSNDNTIIKIVIPRWVESELKGSNIAKILTAYANDKKQAREANSVFINASEHEVRETGIPTKLNELIFASELERQGLITIPAPTPPMNSGIRIGEESVVEKNPRKKCTHEVKVI